MYVTISQLKKIIGESYQHPFNAIAAEHNIDVAELEADIRAFATTYLQDKSRWRKRHEDTAYDIHALIPKGSNAYASVAQVLTDDERKVLDHRVIAIIRRLVFDLTVI